MPTQESTCQKDLLQSLKWRYATKKFDADKKIPAETWKQIEEALILSPSSFGLQPWKFVIVTNPELKAQLPAFSWNQQQPVECSHLVVVARLEQMTVEYVDKYIERIVEVRGVSKDSLSGNRKMMADFVSNMSAEQLELWMTKQCYIALGNLMTSAALLGIDSCPMEGFVPPEYDRILGLKERGLRSVVLCAMGYRAQDDKYASMDKVRFPAEEIIVRL